MGPKRKRQGENETQYEGLLKTAPTRMQHDAFVAQNPFVSISNSFIDTYKTPGYDIFHSSKVHLDALHAVWRFAMVPALAASTMTYQDCSGAAVRPWLIALACALKKVCTVGPSRAAADNGEVLVSVADPGAAAADEAHAAADETSSEAEQHSDTDPDSCCSIESQHNVLAVHAGTSRGLPGDDAPDVMLWRKRAPHQTAHDFTATQHPNVVKAVIEGTSTLFGAGMEAYPTRGRYQLASYLLAALKENAARKYSGPVVALATSLTHFAAAIVLPTGAVTIDEEGKQVKKKGGFFEADLAQEALDAALPRVRALKDCASVERLRPGAYIVGTCYFSKVLPFLTLPMATYPNAVAVALPATGYAALQALLCMCAGAGVASWDEATVLENLAEWERRVQHVQDGVRTFMTEELWAAGKAFVT